MNKPAIESDDRGVTINKSLAWSMVGGLMAVGIWIGVEITRTSEGISNAMDGINRVDARQSEDRKNIRANTEAIASLRTGNARVEQRLSNIEQTSQRNEVGIQEVLRYLRGTLTPEDRKEQRQ